VTTLKDFYFSARKILRENGIENPDLVARYLIKESVNVADIDIIINSGRLVSAAQESLINDHIKRHISGEPISRIFGEREFWGIPFKITPDVLDPRQDTETIIEASLKRFIGNPPERVLDMGTGSGCIIISLLSEWPNAKGVAVDISEKALAVAEENARINNLQKRIRFIQSNWGDSVKGKYDVIVSNPPYISNHEITNLSPEVKNYDPILALSGGDDGLDCYKIIISQIKRLLKQSGAAFLEIGYTQADEVMRLVGESGLSVSTVHPDITGILRVVEISSGEK